MSWWKYYGFFENPLDIRPNSDLIGIDNLIKEIKDSIRSDEIILIYGPVGSGKTSLAFKLLKDLSEDYLILYVNGEANRNINLIKFVQEKSQKKFLFFTKKIEKPIVLILDEFYNFDAEVVKQLKYLYDNRIVKSAILIQISDALVNVTPSFSNRLFRKIEMPRLSAEDIIKIVRKRLKDRIKFNEDFLRKIIIKNDYNVRSVLIELNNLLKTLKHPIKEEINLLNSISTIIEEQITTSDEDVEVKLSPQQLEIVKALIGNKLNTKKIAEITNIKISSLNKQISRLVNAGILLKEEVNNEVYYYINPKYYKAIVKLIGK